MADASKWDKTLEALKQSQAAGQTPGAGAFRGMGTETHISLSIRIYIHINMRHTILPERAPMAQLLPSPRCMVYQGDREETIGPTRSRPHLRGSTPTIGGGERDFKLSAR